MAVVCLIIIIEPKKCVIVELPKLYTLPTKSLKTPVLRHRKSFGICRGPGQYSNRSREGEELELKFGTNVQNMV
jgi:hypothetical protein